MVAPGDEGEQLPEIRISVQGRSRTFEVLALGALASLCFDSPRWLVQIQAGVLLVGMLAIFAEGLIERWQRR